MKRFIAALLVTVTIAASSTAVAADSVSSETQSYWNYPRSKPQVESVGDGEALCVQATSDSFKTVVKYYCDRAGFVPPNWNILGREFPGDNIYMPGFWTAPGKLATGEAARVGLTHNIRPDAAQATFLVRIAGESSNVCVSISRGKSESETTIHVLSNTQR
jgi:hypothetical protein